MMVSYGIAVVGTSWGGLAALRELVSCLPADLVIPIVLVQHRHKQSDHTLQSLLQDRTALDVCEVEDKTPIERGKIFVAPADYHLLVELDSFALSVDDPVRYARPASDLPCASAADYFGAATIGVVLTGANADGSMGLRRIVDRGGLALVQEPATAESPAMPTAALKAVPSARVMTVGAIGSYIRELSPTQAAPAPHVRPQPGEERHQQREQRRVVDQQRHEISEPVYRRSAPLARTRSRRRRSARPKARPAWPCEMLNPRCSEPGNLSLFCSIFLPRKRIALSFAAPSAATTWNFRRWNS